MLELLTPFWSNNQNSTFLGCWVIQDIHKRSCFCWSKKGKLWLWNLVQKNRETHKNQRCWSRMKKPLVEKNASVEKKQKASLAKHSYTCLTYVYHWTRFWKLLGKLRDESSYGISLTSLYLIDFQIVAEIAIYYCITHANSKNCIFNYIVNCSPLDEFFKRIIRDVEDMVLQKA